MWTAIKNHISARFSDGEARVLCYVMGPLSGGLMLKLRDYGAIWSVRFHAFHSMLMGALWASSWLMLRLAEEIAPSWFAAAVVRELRSGMNFAFCLAWIVLLFSAYGGSRCAVVPWLHALAVRFARKSQRQRA